MELPILETERLRIRPFRSDDLEDTHQLFSAGSEDDSQINDEQLAAQRIYVEWNTLNHIALAQLEQPPTGDRVIELKSGEFVGACGVFSMWGPYGRLPTFGNHEDSLSWAEVALFWSVLPQYQRNGYATEAAKRLTEVLFDRFHLQRIIAFTANHNKPSQRVMEKIGMKLEQNPFPEPGWLQVIGILEHPK